MWYNGDVEIQRTVTICLPADPDLLATLNAFTVVQNAVTEACFNEGTPLNAVQLQRLVYAQVKGMLNSQMTITALRLVAGAYASARRGYARRLAQEKRRKERCERKGWTYTPHRVSPPGLCRFSKPMAMFLVGKRGRDAAFRTDGTLSIWTMAGRKHITYTVPAKLRPLFDAATEIDSVTVVERGGKLYGRVAFTLDAPEPAGVLPVGVDLNETNALVAVDADGRALFISGLATKVRNRRTMQTTTRVQRKLATRKAEGKDTRSVRRALKRLGGRRKRRTRDFARVAAKRLVTWAPVAAVLVFEDLRISRPEKGLTRGVALRRRLSLWQYGAVREAVLNKARIAGIAVAFVDPAYTSKRCARCGLPGVRRRHRFTCPHCGHQDHADQNAAVNIRQRFVQSRLDGEQSTSPEALPREG
jgi:IS605 OrfB family transposase